jgi:acetylornithine/succinyldiaminopimelate/putrescine aminotransferase
MNSQTMATAAMDATPAAALDASAEEARWLLPVYAHTPVEPVRGAGALLWTRDGRELIDFYGGHAVALLGYRHPRLLAALAAQAESLFFQSNSVPLAVRARAARRLVGFGPEGLGRAFLVNSGAEANENALRLALRATGRTRVVALEGAFHGRTAAAAAVSHGGERWYGFPWAPFDVAFVPRGDLAALEAALAADGGAAALIVEPIQGLAGAVDLGADYLRAARELTRQAGALLIFDEVQCGMGRTGHPFAAQAYGVTPDLLTVAKGLAGGFPAGALLASEQAAQGIGVGDLGSTFGGGPLACALIEATIDAIEGDVTSEIQGHQGSLPASETSHPVSVASERVGPASEVRDQEDRRAGSLPPGRGRVGEGGRTGGGRVPNDSEEKSLLANVRALSRRIRETCVVGPVDGIQGEGFLLGLRTSRPAKEVMAELLERGILAGTSNDPRVLRLLPPLVLEEQHVEALARALAEIPR